MTKSASAPGASAPFRPARPASRAGAAAIHSPSRSGFTPRRCIAVHITGSARPRLAIPPQARSQRPSSRCFIAGGQGEWSVVTMSISALIERLPQRFAIGRAANRRRAFVLRCAVGDLFSREPKIVGAGFDGDGHAALARRSQQRQSLRAGQVHDVDRRRKLLGQANEQCDGINLRGIGPRGQIGRILAPVGVGCVQVRSWPRRPGRPARRAPAAAAPCLAAFRAPARRSASSTHANPSIPE